MFPINHIEVLSDAEDDLKDGKQFYENQEHGLGQYFWDSLLSDIESLLLYAGIHTKQFGYFRMT